jgi:hypothetical protein
MEVLSMKFLVLPRRRENVPVEELLPHATAEIQAVWNLYTQGICREFYARADQPGAAILALECPTVEVAEEAIATLPLRQLDLLDFELIPLAPFTHLTRLFRDKNVQVR